MDHIQPFIPRRVLRLPTVKTSGWTLKRYGILTEDRKYDSTVALSAIHAAINQLPEAGNLENPEDNHGIGFQLVHFAEVAVVSPVFYWIWGSVLANTHQLRAQWESSSDFETGVSEVVGCIWEMQIVCFEMNAWTNTLLGNTGTSNENLSRYLAAGFPSAELAL